MVSLAYYGATGDFYVAASDSQRLCCVVAATGQVVTAARGFTGFAPCCLEIDEAGRRLWVTDLGANRVYELCLAGTLDVGNEVPAEGGADGGSLIRSLSAWPNPARAAARVRLVLAREAEVRVDVLDLSGRRVRRLADARFLPGERVLAWDGSDTNGGLVPPGVYIVSARTSDGERSTRIALLR
jgi:hypothetical protein